MTNAEPRQEPQPSAPGYGDKGPAGGGRDGDRRNEAAEPPKESGGPDRR